MTGRTIDNTQTTHSEAAAIFQAKALIVGTSVTNLAAHGLKRRHFTDTRAQNETCDAAHEENGYTVAAVENAAAVRGRGPLRVYRASLESGSGKLSAAR